MREQLSVADVLDRAADLIEREGWSQIVGNEPTNPGCQCAHTAIMIVDNQLRTKADDFFAKFLGGDRLKAIWQWNDAPERTQVEVVAKLREAAEAARKSGQPS